MRIAFLGLGRMGAAMAAHVARSAAHELTVWNRTPGKGAALVELGATEAATAAEAVAGADVIVLMLFGPDAVREVLADITGKARPGALVLDATTNGPQAAHEFARTCEAAGLRYVDAPVAGTVQPATDGTLGVFAGATDDDWGMVRPLLELWGDPERVVHVGPVGSASALKLCVNQGLGIMAAGVGEALRLGSDLGVDRTLLLDVLGKGSYGWFLNQKRPMVESGDFTPTTFSIDLMAKDLDLAVTSAGADLTVTRAALEQARRAVAAGHSGEDYAAISGHVADEGEASSH